MKQTLVALVMAATMGISGCSKGEKQHVVEHLTGDPVSVIVDCNNDKNSRTGYISTSLEVDGEIILADAYTSCRLATKAATVIDSATKRDHKIELTVCHPNGEYKIHGINAEGYAITF